MNSMLSRYYIIRNIFLFILITPIFGCMSTAPVDNAPFSKITSIDQLEGTYKNKGDSGPGNTYNIYLSQIIWPSEKSVVDKDISLIKVKKISDTSLKVSAIHDGAVVKSAIFTRGKDFKIGNGVIVITNKIAIAGFKSGEPMLGVYTESRQLGIDEKGQGKYHSSGAAAGLAYLFLPIALVDSTDVRFYRVK